MIEEGHIIPNTNLFREENGWSISFSSHEFFTGKKVLVFALPGAFTKICSEVHLPGYISNADKFISKGVDIIVCLATNDALVMKAWGDHYLASNIINMVSDGNGEFTRLMGLQLDETQYGMGIRSQRYAMLVEDKLIKNLAIEEPGQLSVSTADKMLVLI
ncbi:MAG: hypothetical protein CBC38_02930 [Gammaproteobacteria bacterium TMED78]|nr:MAG: hypothetical protein CBC38_02930 [Gammaproteobacteria bacterium TMED78]|tara:strand:- start:48730 stop:49209 length:480 start_codon:yes stop_codon:yes gene_type:complete